MCQLPIILSTYLFGCNDWLFESSVYATVHFQTRRVNNGIADLLLKRPVAHTCHWLLMLNFPYQVLIDRASFIVGGSGTDHRNRSMFEEIARVYAHCSVECYCCGTTQDAI